MVVHLARRLRWSAPVFVLATMGCGDDALSTGGGGAGPGGAGGSGASFAQGGAGGMGGFGACVELTADAQPVPAAVLIVLDRTASMTTLDKWTAAQSAILEAIDKASFDTASLGLLTFPNPTSVPGPDCIANYPIYCEVAADPQVAIQLAGPEKHTGATGVRRSISDELSATSPQVDDAADSSPIYPALSSAYAALRAVPGVERRVVLLVTDGGGSCASISDPVRPAYVDPNGCLDWDEPPFMAELIAGAHTDPTAPIETFIVGVPGSDSVGEDVGTYSTPPYHMKLALSTYAVAGSPDTVDPGCDKALAFTQNGADPAVPCHYDLSDGDAFNADALAGALTALRRTALGCTYPLPDPPEGQAIELDQVNVFITVDEGTQQIVPRRSSSADDCASSPCWDYDAENRITLIGAACVSLSEATNARVEIDIGCETLTK